MRNKVVMSGAFILQHAHRIVQEVEGAELVYVSQSEYSIVVGIWMLRECMCKLSLLCSNMVSSFELDHSMFPFERRHLLHCDLRFQSGR